MKEDMQQTSDIALKDVASTLTVEGILAELVLAWVCLKKAGCDNPKIAVAGLNPHAGENGTMGHEDAATVAPAIAQLQAEGIDARGPYPAEPVRLSCSDVTQGHSDAERYSRGRAFLL